MLSVLSGLWEMCPVSCAVPGNIALSGVKKFFGPDVVRASIKIQKLEDQKDVIAALVAMGTEIGNRVRKSRFR